MILMTLSKADPDTLSLSSIPSMWSLICNCYIWNSYTMGCRPLCGDNPGALSSVLSYVKVDKHGITDLYHRQFRACTLRDLSHYS